MAQPCILLMVALLDVFVAISANVTVRAREGRLQPYSMTANVIFRGVLALAGVLPVEFNASRYWTSHFAFLVSSIALHGDMAGATDWTSRRAWRGGSECQ
jgi:hypothetical protein